MLTQQITAIVIQMTEVQSFNKTLGNYRIIPLNEPIVVT